MTSKPKTCAQLQGARLQKAQLQGASLQGAQLQGVEFSNGPDIYMSWSKWGAQLQGAQLEGASLQGASLQGAQLQGAQLNKARLQGAWLVGARLQGASLDGAQLLGAILGDVQLRGASLNGTQLQGASLSDVDFEGADLNQVFVWRTTTINIRNAQQARIIQPKFKREYEGLDCATSTPCIWSKYAFAELKKSITDEIPRGKLYGEALSYIWRLDPHAAYQPPIIKNWSPQFWTEMAQNPPASQEYEKALAQILKNTGCAADGAPYVIHGLIRTLDDRFTTDRSRATAVAAAFLDESNCPGARGLSEQDKVSLRKKIPDGASGHFVSNPTPAQ